MRGALPEDAHDLLVDRSEEGLVSCFFAAAAITGHKPYKSPGVKV